MVYQMKSCGIDLAGMPKNPTGFCTLTEDDGVKTVDVKIFHTDDDILVEIEKQKPDVVALDAPTTYAGVNRQCDHELAEYGALPVTLPGMEVLAIRGMHLSEKISERHNLIEVSAKSSAKILGLYRKDDFPCQKQLLSLDLSGDINNRILTRDELDAAFAAITGILHLIGQGRTVGDEAGKIIIPEV